MVSRVATLALLLYCCAHSVWAQAQPRPVPAGASDPAVVEVVLRAELAHSSYPPGACLEMNGADPERQLFAFLKSKGLRFHKASWCRRAPRGVVFSLNSVKMEGGRIEITVEAVDNSLHEVDFADLLHKTRYLLENQEHGPPRIVSSEKLCCETPGCSSGKQRPA